MALSEVVLEIAEEMIREADDLKLSNEFLWMTLRNYAKQLKVAVKASAGVPAQDSQTQGAVFIHPDAQHFQMIEQARKELRDQKKQAEGQENFEPRFVVCQGGPADGDTVSINSGMPLGAYTLIDGGVYSLQDLVLEFDEAATKARKEGK